MLIRHISTVSIQPFWVALFWDSFVFSVVLFMIMSSMSRHFAPEMYSYFITGWRNLMIESLPWEWGLVWQLQVARSYQISKWWAALEGQPLRIRAAYMCLFLRKRQRDFSVRIWFKLRFCCFRRFCCFPEILLIWIRTEKSFGLFPENEKRGRYRLPCSVEAALQGHLITSNPDRTWLPGAALLIPIMLLNGATLITSET